MVRAMQRRAITIPRTADPRDELDELQIYYGRTLFIGRALSKDALSGWQPGTTAALLTAWDLTSSESTVFFDVGANIGIYAQLHSRGRPDGTAVAFEPTPEVADWGEKMTAENHVDVRWERMAVSDADGEATLYLSARTDASNSLVSGHREPKDAVTVPTVTLDRYVRSSGLVPGVVKIDVERHEPAVLRGAHDLLAEHRPVVVAELLEHRSESEEVLKLLDGHGYQARHIEPPDGANVGDTPRDWIFWPDAVPEEFDSRFRAWFAAVQRCVPQQPEQQPEPAAQPVQQPVQQPEPPEPPAPRGMISRIRAALTRH